MNKGTTVKLSPFHPFTVLILGVGISPVISQSGNWGGMVSLEAVFHDLTSALLLLTHNLLPQNQNLRGWHGAAAQK